MAKQTRHVSAYMKGKIKALAKKGLTRSEIAEITGFSVKTISLHWKNKPHPNRITDDEKKLMRKLKVEGMANSVIAKRLGRHEASVEKVTKGYGKPGHCTPEEKEKMRKLRGAGWMVKAIAEKVGRHESCVKRIVKGVLAKDTRIYELMRELKKDGLTNAKIGDITGYSPTTVEYHTKDMDLGVVPKGDRHGMSKLTEEIINEVLIPLAQDNVDGEEIARRINQLYGNGISANSVRQVIRGRTWRHVTKGRIIRYAVPSKGLTRAQYLLAIELRKQNWSYGRIERHIGVTNNMVARALKKTKDPNLPRNISKVPFSERNMNQEEDPRKVRYDNRVLMSKGDPMLTTKQEQDLQKTINELVEGHAECCFADGEECPPENDMVNQAIDALLFRIEENGVWGLMEDGTLVKSFLDGIEGEQMDAIDDRAKEFLKARKIT